MNGKVSENDIIRVAVYARYSSDNQREESIEAQIRACKYFVQKENLSIVKVYCDRAKSGMSIKGRTEFLQMIDDSDKKMFDVVLVHKLNRFGRDSLETLKFKKQLERNSVTLISVTEKLDNSPEGKLLLMVMAGINEFFSANLSNEVMKGMKESAYQGLHVGGTPPLGYDVDKDTRKYVINEEEAKIIKAIFEKYADGEGYNQILSYINGMGYRTKKGIPFGKNSLYSILKNEKYSGVYVFNKKLEKSPAGTRNPKIKPKDEWIVIDGGVPAIVDKETFDKVQLKLNSNLKNGGGKFKAKEVYLLSSLVFCGECNSGMYGNTRYCGRGKSKYSSYRCSDRVQHKGCQNKEIRKEYLDNYVLDQLHERLFSDNSIKKLSAMLNDYNTKMISENNDELKIFQKQLDEANQKISSIVKLVSESGISINTVKDSIKELEEQKDFYELQIKHIADTVKLSSIDEGAITQLIEKSRDFVKAKNIPECRNFIENYVEKVIVFNDRVEIIFKINVLTDDKSIEQLKSYESIKVLQKEYRNTVNA
jgi:site-specific DNA recombinase